MGSWDGWKDGLAFEGDEDIDITVVFFPGTFNRRSNAEVKLTEAVMTGGLDLVIYGGRHSRRVYVVEGRQEC
jgi:hypothetical protein